MLVDMGQSEIDGSSTLAGKSQAAHETSASITAASGVDVPRRESAIDLILLPGDISYARSHGYQWDNFGYEIEPLSARIPWMMGLGNHDRDDLNSGSFYDGGTSGVGGSRGECGVPAEYRYLMPGSAIPESGREVPFSKSGKPMEAWKWYSFNYGSVHISMISTEHDLSNSSSQYQWLAQDLRSVNRSMTPWVVLAGHRPMYVDTSTSADLEAGKLLQTQIEDLLVETGVDFALWGHTHNCQRTCKVHKSKCVDESKGSSTITGSGRNGVVHLLAGHAGYHSSLYPLNPRPTYIDYLSLGTHGWCRANVVSAKMLVIECIDNANGAIVHSVTLLKDDHIQHAHLVA